MHVECQKSCDGTAPEDVLAVGVVVEEDAEHPTEHVQSGTTQLAVPHHVEDLLDEPSLPHDASVYLTTRRLSQQLVEMLVERALQVGGGVVPYLERK